MTMVVHARRRKTIPLKRSITLAAMAVLALALVAGYAWVTAPRGHPPLRAALIGRWRILKAPSSVVPSHIPSYRFDPDGALSIEYDFAMGRSGRYRVLDDRHIEFREYDQTAILTIDMDGDQLQVTFPSGQQDRCERMPEST
jgi:hypothetical protein